MKRTKGMKGTDTKTGEETQARKKGRSIFGMSSPPEHCNDTKCPFHGTLRVKKELAEGVVIKRDLNRSATIEWHRSIYIPKYERYAFRRSHLRVHNPACVDAQLGDRVLAARTRPLSKTKHHVLLGKVRSQEVQNIQEKNTQEEQL